MKELKKEAKHLSYFQIVDSLQKHKEQVEAKDELSDRYFRSIQNILQNK
jgi:hypothetical protein